MKKILSIFILSVLFALTSYSVEYKRNTHLYQKAISIKAGANFTIINTLISGGVTGPTAGVAWEKWKTPERGFMTELHTGYSTGLPWKLSDDSSREIASSFNLTVPILWAFKYGDHFAFKLGLQPNLLVLIPVSEIASNGCMRMPFLLIPELNIPLCFTYYITEKFSLDFRLTVPGIIIREITPLNFSLGVNASWRFLRMHIR